MILAQPHLYGCRVSVRAVQRVWRERLAVKGIPMVRDLRTLKPFISDNRWVADCLSCGSGIEVWAENPEACCLACGSVFSVEMPNDYEAAEKVLESRPPANRHWFPEREPVAKLEVENEKMGGIAQRPSLMKAEPVRAVFDVHASFGSGLDEAMEIVAKTGYTIRYDDGTGWAEVELDGKPDRDVEHIRSLIDKKV